MLGRPLVYLALAIGAAPVAVTGAASSAGGIAQTLFFVFLVCFVVLLVMRLADRI